MSYLRIIIEQLELFIKSISITEEKHLKLHNIAHKPRQFVVEF